MTDGLRGVRGDPQTKAYKFNISATKTKKSSSSLLKHRALLEFPF